ncbi:MAG TPA: hypothetical protein VHP58_00030 [Alphaproteobacteria bacterium]|nr:hypothetical protein [Alphaproteobacteria bacterium]
MPNNNPKENPLTAVVIPLVEGQVPRRALVLPGNAKRKYNKHGKLTRISVCGIPVLLSRKRLAASLGSTSEDLKRLAQQSTGYPYVVLEGRALYLVLGIVEEAYLSEGGQYYGRA